MTYRHPGLLAKIVTTLDVLSGGRAVLGHRRRLVRARAPRPRRAVPAGGRAVRAAGGDAADRAGRCGATTTGRTRAALPAGRDDQLAAAGAQPAPADHDRRRRRAQDAAAGRAVRRRAATCSPARGPAVRPVAAKLDVLREHCDARRHRLRRDPPRPCSTPAAWTPPTPQPAPRFVEEMTGVRRPRRHRGARDAVQRRPGRVRPRSGRPRGARARHGLTGAVRWTRAHRDLERQLVARPAAPARSSGWS